DAAGHRLHPLVLLLGPRVEDLDARPSLDAGDRVAGEDQFVFVADREIPEVAAGNGQQDGAGLEPFEVDADGRRLAATVPALPLLLAVPIPGLLALLVAFLITQRGHRRGHVVAQRDRVDAADRGVDEGGTDA